MLYEWWKRRENVSNRTVKAIQMHMREYCMYDGYCLWGISVMGIRGGRLSSAEHRHRLTEMVREARP